MLNDSTLPNSSSNEQSTEPNREGRSTYQVLRGTWLTRRPRPLSALVAAIMTAVMAAFAILYLTNAQANSLMSASYNDIFTNHEYWRAWTTLFAHADAGHLLSNSFLFFILGVFLYGYFGSLLYPIGAIFWGGLINLVILPTYMDPDTKLIGMSGVVYWMGGAWLILYFFLSLQKSWAHRYLRTLGVAILIFMPAETFDPVISYRTHFAGFIGGILAGGIHYAIHRKKFLAANRYETIVEENDLEDEMPGPNGPTAADA